jgi:hypothetical protein
MKIVDAILLLSTHLPVLPHSVLDSNFPCSFDPQSSLAANNLSWACGVPERAYRPYKLLESK